jgi:hypothetical protein
MDQTVPNQQQSQKENKGLMFLEIGIFEIAFVAVILGIFFGVMNYFNILPISQLWPKQLGFLPRRDVPTGTSPHREQNNKPIPKPTQTPTNYSSNVFQYDSEKANTIISKYIKDTLKPEFIPQTLDAKQGLSIDNRDEDIKNQFGSYFVNNQATFSINFHYTENTNYLNDFLIFIQPSKVEQKTLNSTLATSLTSFYFTNPYTPIANCNTKGTTSYCEEFKTETDGKRGFGVVLADDQSTVPPKRTAIVFTCFIPKESKDYNKQSSCISP